MDGITFFDILVIAILCILTIRGGLRGMMSQIVSLASIVIAWFVAASQSAHVAPLISIDEPWNRVVAMLCLFVGTWIGVWFLYRFIAGMFKTVRLRAFDRQMGALFGFIKGFALCLLITFFGISMDWSRDSVYQSKSGYYLTHALNRIQAVVPEDIWSHVQERLQQYGFSLREPLGDYGWYDTGAGDFLGNLENLEVLDNALQTGQGMFDSLSAMATGQGLLDVPPSPSMPVNIFASHPSHETPHVELPRPALTPVRAAMPFDGESSSSTNEAASSISSHRAWSQAIRDSER